MPIPDDLLQPPRDGAPFHDLAAEDAERLVRDGAGELLVLDVRTPREHAIHRIPGATLIPIQELQQRAGELDPDRPTLVYCEHGIRSVSAAAFLGELGVEHVYNLRGGLAQWRGEREGAACG